MAKQLPNEVLIRIIRESIEESSPEIWRPYFLNDQKSLISRPRFIGVPAYTNLKLVNRFFYYETQCAIAVSWSGTLSFRTDDENPLSDQIDQVDIDRLNSATIRYTNDIFGANAKPCASSILAIDRTCVDNQSLAELDLSLFPSLHELWLSQQCFPALERTEDLIIRGMEPHKPTGYITDWLLGNKKDHVQKHPYKPLDPLEYSHVKILRTYWVRFRDADHRSMAVAVDVTNIERPFVVRVLGCFKPRRAKLRRL